MRLPRQALRATTLALLALATCQGRSCSEQAYYREAQATSDELYGYIGPCRIAEWGYKVSPIIRDVHVRWVACCGDERFVCWRRRERHLGGIGDAALCAEEHVARRAEQDRPL